METQISFESALWRGWANSGDSRMKKVGGHCGAREKVEGAT